MLYDEAAVFAKLEVTPEQVADFKGLKGDPSDNIPGVPGVGEKTAVKLLAEFASVAGIYERLEEVNPPKLREKLRENEAAARQSKWLATIVTDVPLDFKLADTYASRYRRDAAVALFRELEFFSLVDKLPKRLELDPGSVVGGNAVNNSVKFDGTLAGAAPPLVNVAVDPLASPCETPSPCLTAANASASSLSFSPIICSRACQAC